MTTQEFIDQLRRALEKPLLFVNTEGDTIHAGYHLTEIKAAKFDTVDCGGEKNRWNETILQLWVPADPDDEYMVAGKFVSIYDKVSKTVSIDEEAEVRIEYGDKNFFPATYHIDNLSETKDSLRFVLEPPSTTCKAQDRRLAGAQSCCA